MFQIERQPVIPKFNYKQVKSRKQVRQFSRYSDYNLGERTDESGFDSRQGNEILPSTKSPDRLWGPASLRLEVFRGFPTRFTANGV